MTNEYAAPMELKDLGWPAFYKHDVPTELRTKRKPRRGEIGVLN